MIASRLLRPVDNPPMSAPLAGAALATDLSLPSDAAADAVSILVRSMARPSLAGALASIVAQTRRPLEVVVVNASGKPHPPLPDPADGLHFRLVDADRPLPRAVAANHALQAAQGRWLLFLDDDDTLDVDHVARLHAALQTNPGQRVAHTGVRLTDAEGHTVGVLDEPVDARSLWSANRLAIHAVLFERSLVDEGARFDESLDVYEDWDFWFQLARRVPFLHQPGVSASYRLVGNSGASEPHDAEASRRLRLPFYRKWLPQLSADELEGLAARVEHVRGSLGDALAQLHEARSSLAASDTLAQGLQSRAQSLQAHADALQQQIRALHHDLATREAELQQAHVDRKHDAAVARKALSDLRAERRALHDQLQRALHSYRELEQGYRAVTASLSWRLTQPLRRLRTLATRQQGVTLGRRLWRTLPLDNSQRLRLRNWVLARGWGQGLARQLAPQLVLPAEPARPPQPPTDKERVRAQAEAALGDFLRGQSRIELGCKAAAPDVSVIVVLFNQAGLSRMCLQSLADSQGVNAEALVVDNGSSDRVPQLLERVDGATVLRPGKNLGFLLAVNQAAKQARGRYLVLLNNDAMLEPHTLRDAVARLDADPSAGAAGGPILLWDGQLQEAGSIVWRDGSCQGYGRGDDPARPEYQFVRDVDYCSGAFLVLRRSLFESMGGLDPAFVPAYYEESDFCVRLWESGQRIVYDPQLRIRHFEFASEVSAGSAIELQRRHQALFVQRHADFLAGQPLPSAQAVLRARMRLPAGAKRVLVIDDRVPLPWLGQGYPRAALMVRALAEAGHAVTHYPLQFPGETWAEVRRALPETVEVMLGHGLIGLEPFLQARQGLYDCVIVSRPHNMQVLQQLRSRQPELLHPARLIYDAEAMFSLRDIARAELDGRPLPLAEQRQRIAEELALAAGVDAIVAVSEREAAHYRDAGFDPVRVLGHEVEVVSSTPGFDSRSGFVFVGAMTDDDTPNSDSLRWFVAEVWPRVVAALGADVHLHLVGPCEAPSVRALAGPGITVHGRVDHLAPHLDSARVFIAPTRYAAGIPHKAHEAAARGLPMVVTGLIADQLGWQPFVAHHSDAAGFAAACVQLHQDRAVWQLQREQLLAAVARDCSRAAFRATVSALVDNPPAAVSTLNDDDRRTAELWGRDAEQRADSARQRRHWSSHPVTAAEINLSLSGDTQIGWVAHLKRCHFQQPRRRGLSLGCGSGAVVIDALQLGIVEQMEGVDISDAAVAVARAAANRAGLADRARWRAANVNGLALDGPYDLIVFEQSLHHVDALDAVLDRCHAALASDGLLVINEYVGPDRFQWSDEAERLMNAMLALLPDSHRRDPDSGALKTQMRRADPQAVIALDPSEAIHSGAIVQACAARFETVERRDFGGTLLQFMLADIAANFDPDEPRDVALLRLMSLLETELIRCGAIDSDFIYAVYRRRDVPAAA